MGIEEMKNIKTQLISCVQNQTSNLQQADAKELGEAVDMIKDLSEAIYYCTITDAMEKSEKDTEKNGSVTNLYYTTPNYYKKYPDEMYRQPIEDQRFMYYTPMPSNGTSMTTNMGQNNSNNNGMRDPREGRAAIRRKMYMEGKEQHKDVNTQLNELQAYLKELSTDITEMIRDASPEEKAALHQKMTVLANKIV